MLNSEQINSKQKPEISKFSFRKAANAELNYEASEVDNISAKRKYFIKMDYRQHSYHTY
jgi:hypothetical protein